MKLAFLTFDSIQIIIQLKEWLFQSRIQSFRPETVNREMCPLRGKFRVQFHLSFKFIPLLIEYSF